MSKPQIKTNDRDVRITMDLSRKLCDKIEDDISRATDLLGTVLETDHIMCLLVMLGATTTRCAQHVSQVLSISELGGPCSIDVALLFCRRALRADGKLTTEELVRLARQDEEKLR